ncbi:MAG TPA: urea ABC transporter ATP-binding subunit UrtE [Beijerinckiaceae bacterium]|jgi:urea transport system ATP-binding protein|nr:urea ABC transporter ATP-binding subunit UrtE [Beijerinckiaceae bacterium]
MLNVEKLDLFYGAAQAVRGVSLAAARGEVTCVLGRNGVGKTTLLRAVIGQQQVRAGSVFFDGQNITALAPHRRARRGIAYVPQGREIFPLLTVRENLETGFAALSRDRRSIPDEIFSLFPVLKDMLRRRGGDLSGGQQQQLAIARALVMRPKLIVFDEPTEGIQPSIIAQIGRTIDYLRRSGEIAILLVEQYFDFARELADKFYVMDRGEIVLSGTGANMDEAAVRRLMSV